MKYYKYKIEDINIGDEIYFDSTPSQYNYDLFWPVHDKDDKNLFVKLNDDYWTVNIDSVRHHIPSKKTK